MVGGAGTCDGVDFNVDDGLLALCHSQNALQVVFQLWVHEKVSDDVESETRHRRRLEKQNYLVGVGEQLKLSGSQEGVGDDEARRQVAVVGDGRDEQLEVGRQLLQVFYDEQVVGLQNFRVKLRQ